jgi:hypothetical protein
MMLEMGYKIIKVGYGLIRDIRTYEHSEKARAPQTNGPSYVPRCGALSLLKKPL